MSSKQKYVIEIDADVKPSGDAEIINATVNGKRDGPAMKALGRSLLNYAPPLSVEDSLQLILRFVSNNNAPDIMFEALDVLISDQESRRSQMCESTTRSGQETIEQQGSSQTPLEDILKELSSQLGITVEAVNLDDLIKGDRDA